MVLQSHHFQNFSFLTFQCLNVYICPSVTFLIFAPSVFDIKCSFCFIHSFAHAVSHPDLEYPPAFLLLTCPWITVHTQSKWLVSIYVSGCVLGSDDQALHKLQPSALRGGQEALNHSYSARVEEQNLNQSQERELRAGDACPQWLSEQRGLRWV